jgi:hypothetical protein
MPNKQHKHTLFDYILTRMYTCNLILIFYDHEIDHRKLSVKLSGFIIRYCNVIKYNSILVIRHPDNGHRGY